jgi:hypothetical protein
MRSCGWGPHSGISVLRRRGREVCTSMISLSHHVLPSAMLGCSKKPSPDARSMSLDFPASRTMNQINPYSFQTTQFFRCSDGKALGYEQ